MNFLTFFLLNSYILHLFKNITAYQKALFENETTCKETVEQYLSNIEKTKHLNAVVEVFEEESRSRAEWLDNKRNQGAPCGKLHGIIISIKDVICYKNHKVTAASKMLSEYTAIYDSTVVKKLLEEDALIIGRCNCDEFAMGNTNENSIYGRVKNPHDPAKVPGGSSGGSAVAVQAGLCMVSIGSDTGGSVRQPADFCGVFGFKPSYGAVSRHGLLAYASSFDQVGVISKSPEDAAKIFEVIAGKDEYDSTVSARKFPSFNLMNISSGNNATYKIAVVKNLLDHSSLDSEIKESINKEAQKLKNAGHLVTEIEIDLVDFMVPAYYILTTAEASSNLSRYDGVRYGFRSGDQAEDITTFYKNNRSQSFGKEVKKRIMLGTYVLSEGFFEAYYTKAQQVRKLLADQSKEIFSQFDILLMPTVPSTAFDSGSTIKDPIAMYLADIYTIFANLTGIPGASVPLFKHSNGMPFGLQVLSKRYNDTTVLEFAQMLLNSQKENAGNN